MCTEIAISKDIFRAYDIRGIVGETLTPEIVYHIAVAIGEYAQAKNQHTVIIARDGRLSAVSFSEALAKGLLDSGCRVIDIGAVPTPVLYFATHILPTQSGIMLTGSHNPGNYNGLKMVIAGQTLSEDSIQEIYRRVVANKNKNISGHHNPHYQTTNIIDHYIQRIAQDIRLQKKLHIVVDAGNGIAGKLVGDVYRALGCTVTELFCEVDGHFPYHHPDPSIPENLTDLITAVQKHKADIGLAFDGDGDRLGVVTDQGYIIWPDRQMMLFSKDVLSRCPHEKIIFDVKCTRNLAMVIQQLGGIPEMWKTGHSVLKSRMVEQHSPLSGEMSGHIFFKERWYGFDDGLYAGARLLEILSQDTRSCHDVFKDFPDSINTPELKLSVNTMQREKILTALPKCVAFQKANLITIDGVRAEFAHAWGLVRGSNTTPHLTLRFEADDQAHLDQIQQLFREALLSIDQQLILPF